MKRGPLLGTALNIQVKHIDSGVRRATELLEIMFQAGFNSIILSISNGNMERAPLVVVRLV